MMTARTLERDGVKKGGIRDAFANPGRLLIVCLSILGLYLQIVAATACWASPSGQDSAAGAAPFPICHSGDSSAGDKSPGGSGDDHEHTGQTCPLCAAHHQIVAAPGALTDFNARPAVGLPAAPAITLRPGQPPAFFPAGTSPRGPPAAI